MIYRDEKEEVDMQIKSKQKLKRWGNNLGIRFTGSQIATLNWSEGDELEIKVTDNIVIISKLGAEITAEDLLQEIHALSEIGLTGK